jgi:hypothetical protein
MQDEQAEVTEIMNDAALSTEERLKAMAAPRDPAVQDQQELDKDSDILDVITNIDVSPETRASCERELEIAKEHDYREC